MREPFVNGFRRAASSGLVGGSGSAAAQVPHGTSPSLAAQLQRLATEVFSNGYVHAMRWTMLMPIAVVGLAAVSCLGIRRMTAGRPPAASPPAETGAQMTGATSSPGSSGSPGQSPASPSGAGS